MPFVESATRTAATGVTETTLLPSKYLDEIKGVKLRMNWYDLPGAGTLNIPQWDYFNQQGLFIFDAIIVVHSDRFTETDIAILNGCEKCNIPWYIVRSKSDAHINNELEAALADEEPNEEEKLAAYQKIRDNLISVTQQNVRDNLERASLLFKKPYLVSRGALYNLRRGKQVKDPYKLPIDDERLLSDVLGDLLSRRPPVEKRGAPC